MRRNRPRTSLHDRRQGDTSARACLTAKTVRPLLEERGVCLGENPGKLHARLPPAAHDGEDASAVRASRAGSRAERQDILVPVHHIRLVEDWRAGAGAADCRGCRRTGTRDQGRADDGLTQRGPFGFPNIRELTNRPDLEARNKPLPTTRVRRNLVIAARGGTIRAVARPARCHPGPTVAVHPSPSASWPSTDDGAGSDIVSPSAEISAPPLRIENPHAFLFAMALKTVHPPGMTVAPRLLMLPAPGSWQIDTGAIDIYGAVKSR